MCKSDELLSKDSPPPGIRVDSTISGSDDSESDEGSNSNSSNNNRREQQPQRNSRTLPSSATSRRKLRDCLVVKGDDELLNRDMETQYEKARQGTTTSILVSSVYGIIHASFWVAFSFYFPFALAPQAARATYHTAYYHYDPELSRFDNTIWTYGTDYALAVVMTIIVLSIMSHSRKGVSDKLCNRSASLLMLYGISVMAGGLSHQFFHTAESRNSPAFRTLWTTCVGTVCLASTSMGMSGSEALARFQKRELQTPRGMDGPVSFLQRIPILSDAFWLAFGGTITAVCAIGVFSFQRPACDIFIAGITQSLSTFYCMVFFFAVKHPLVKPWAKVMGLVGFIMNAPLLPMYPLLIQYTDWSLASINSLLHSWLCVAWSLQGISMKHVIQALVADDNDESVAADSIVGVEGRLRNNTKKVA
jgi:hypothetical protein